MGLHLKATSDIFIMLIFIEFLMFIFTEIFWLLKNISGTKKLVNIFIWKTFAFE